MVKVSAGWHNILIKLKSHSIPQHNLHKQLEFVDEQTLIYLLNSTKYQQDGLDLMIYFSHESLNYSGQGLEMIRVYTLHN